MKFDFFIFFFAKKHHPARWRPRISPGGPAAGIARGARSPTTQKQTKTRNGSGKQTRAAALVSSKCTKTTLKNCIDLS